MNGPMNEESVHGAVAIVGLAAVMPDAPDAATFWQNIKAGRYSISDVTPDRWDPALYYDPDPHAPDKSYSKIGAWVRAFEWDPLGWKLPIPPRVGDAMDDTQKWAVNLARAALLDYGWPDRPLDTERTAVVIGNAMAGEKHYLSALRISFPEFARDLEESATFAALPKEVREAIVEETGDRLRAVIPAITEDTMPGELANIIAGRVANVFNLRGPNFVTDAACASGLAAMASSVAGLVNGEYDAVLTGGIDRNMGASTYVKFSKIGALSATGTRPYGDGADGFVMGEGGTLFVLKRLADAERDGDRIYAVLLGMAGSSDGKGKGITAPNPIGQRLAVERAWQQAGVAPSTCSLMEGHGTSTPVGDVVEVEALGDVFRAADVPVGAIPLGSVKSNIGHLKGAAGTAGVFKTVMALHEKVLPPSINAEPANPNIEFDRMPFRVNTELTAWDLPPAGIRRAGVSAFGFGGTNFHAVLEEHVSGRRRDGARPVSFARTDASIASSAAPSPDAPTVAGKMPLRGACVMGAADDAALVSRLHEVADRAAAGSTPPVCPPAPADLAAPVRIAIDYGTADELSGKATRAAQALETGNTAMWRALRAQGVFLGRGRPGKVAFLFTGQGSQYVNMLKSLREQEPIVAATFAEADRVMTPLLGKPLTEYIFIDDGDADAVAALEQQLLQTEITQPAVLATDIALTRLLAAYGIVPDIVMGHSLGEYGALVAAGALTFDAALEAVSARGSEMANLTIEDNGAMAAVLAPLDEIERVVASVDGYVVIANVNSGSQAVIGGATAAVERAIASFTDAGHTAIRLPVSHAFHTSIVAPASEPLRQALLRLELKSPTVPTVANVDGELYPMGADVQEQMLDILARQVASPVQFVKGLRTLYAQGARVFVEVGPKKALHGFVEDVLGAEPDETLALFTNHPKQGDAAAFNQALCGLYAAGLGGAADATEPVTVADSTASIARDELGVSDASAGAADPADDRYRALGRLLADFLDRSRAIWQIDGTTPEPTTARTARGDGPPEPVVVTGAALGLPGTERVFDDVNVARILDGQSFIGAIPQSVRESIADKHITRLVKSDAGARFDAIDSADDVIKLAARAGALDLIEEFGVDAERDKALDDCTRLAIGAGFDALRDAGIPLVLHYKTTTVGSQLPDRWGLPDLLRDDTGVIFASAFPGLGEFATDLEHYYVDRARRQELAALRAMRVRVADRDAAAEIDARAAEIAAVLEAEPFEFDRRFLFRVLSMGHSQFAEIIGARGPNTQVNAACASTTQALALAQDWIRAGRCRRVVIVAADNVTSGLLLEWMGAGFLATGAAATDELVEEAAVPFDNRRHGMLLGMGAAGIVVESAEAARERGIQPICEVLGSVTANSAFHGTKLDLAHIAQVMEDVVTQAEARGFERHAMAPETVFISHETYTPARGGSAAAEINALRAVFGADADEVVIANTKGFTGHPMGVGIEDVVAIKALETGIVPPVPNFKEVDPSLGKLNLSIGGTYPVRHALRLAAGFGSQISMTLLRWTPVPDGRHRAPAEVGFRYRIVDSNAWRRWLQSVTGRDDVDLEVVQRRLRVVDRGVPARTPPRIAEPPAAVGTETPAPAVAPPISVPEPAPAAVDVAGAVLAVVADKTGYPSDMLDLDLDLEADLGIDTVKQAEVFATIRERFGIPRDDKLKLRDYPTLAHVVRFVNERAPSATDATAEPVAVAAPEPQPAQSAAEVDVAGAVLAVVADKTGYPSDMLDLDLDLEADLGIDTVKQAEVFATIRERFGIPRDDKLKLRDYPTLAHVVRFVNERAPSATDATAEPVAVAAPEPQPAQSAAEVDVAGAVLAVVADKTGYPSDMLDLDLDLEADLGIDTVKQAEVFATIRERFGIPRDDKLKLRDYPTLAHVVRFVNERAPSATDATAATAAPARPPVADVADADGFPRRVPVPTIRPPLALCAPTGAALVAGTRVVIGSDHGGVGTALAEQLQARGVEVLAINDAPDADALVTKIEGWLASGPIHGVFWLKALDDEGPIDAMDLAAWRESNRVRVKLLYATMRRLFDEIDRPGTFLVTGTRLGGRHGYDDAGASAPLGGGVTGFAKAFAMEKPDALVKAVDVAADDPPADVAQVLVEETLHDAGAVEIGRRGGLRWTITLDEGPAADGGIGMVLDRDTVFVVTGAAGSIVSAITADLAGASGGAFHLLDLTPEPDPEDADLERFATDKEGLKADIIERRRAAGERPTPVMIEKELARLERLAAARAAIDSVRAAGGQVHYHSVDLTNGDAVAQVIADVAARHGRVDVLLHAAGLEISHALPDKEPAEYDLVFGVKSDGWFNLMKAIGDMPLGATVSFSSVAGRFGNLGQTDYAAANDLLCKLTSAMRTTRPETRAIVIDWTAWSSIGMASRGSIPTMMERAGIEMLPPAVGIPTIRRELTAGATRGELLVAGRLGALVASRAEHGGIDPSRFETAAVGPMAGRIVSMTVNDGLTVETALDPSEQPFLDDHQIEGTPVLPGVMGIEAFAEVARLPVPDWHVTEVDDVEFLAPFKFYRGQPRTLTITAKFRSEGDTLVAECCLTGSRVLPNQAEPQVTTHFTGTVRLGPAPVAPVTEPPPPPPNGKQVTADAIYAVYFHGPAYQVLERAWRGEHGPVGLLASRLPSDHVPEERPEIATPRLIELLFQTAGIWEIGRDGRFGLPQHIDQIVLHGDGAPAGVAKRLEALATSSDRGWDGVVVDEVGRVLLEVRGYRTIELPGAVDPDRRQPLADAMA